MCLGVPGRVIHWIDRDALFARATVEFDGITKDCHMACVPDVKVGEYVIVHAGVAISVIEETEAHRIFEELQRLNLVELGENETLGPSEGASS
jgi:hydrogenase expression/formation protein HypC